MTEFHLGVISHPGIPGEKSLNVKQISPRILVEMTVAGFVITSLCPIKKSGEHSKLQESTKSVIGTAQEEPSA